MMSRGVRRKDIFTDDMDRQVFLEILKVSLKGFKCILHAYCLMTNHIHILLETSDIEVGKCMKYMLGCYAMYFNEKYHYKGHLFENRYKSCLVKDDGYFLQTSRYIHLNPVKAGIDGAQKFGRQWAIPAESEKPEDARIKSGRYRKNIKTGDTENGKA